MLRKTYFIRVCIVVIVFVAAGAALATAATVDEAKKLFEDGWWDKSGVMLEEILAADPGNAEAMVDLSRIRLLTDDIDAAEELCEQAIEMNDNNAMYHLIMGQIMAIKSQKSNFIMAIPRAKDARTEFEKAVLVDPHNLDARLALFQYDMQAPGIAGGNLERARAMADSMAAYDSSYHHLAKSLLAEFPDRNYPLAEEELRKAIAVIPDSRAGYIWLGGFLARREEPGKAVEAYREMAAVDSLKMQAYYMMAASYRQLDKPEVAESTYLQILAIDSSQTEAMLQLGLVYQDKKEYENAFAIFEKILAMKPTEVSALYQIGRTCIFAERDYDRAVKSFLTYLASPLKNSWPGPASGHWRLAVVYDKQGKTEAAKTELKKALEINPDYEDAKKLLDEIEDR